MISPYHWPELKNKAGTNLEDCNNEGFTDGDPPEDTWFPMARLGASIGINKNWVPKANNDEYYKDGTIPWIRSGEVDGKFITDSEIKITQSGLKNSSAKLFPPNSILIAMYGATVGKVGMLKITASTNQAVCAIFPNEKVIPKYLYYTMRSQEKNLVSLSVGGAQPNISQTIIKNFQISKLNQSLNYQNI